MVLECVGCGRIFPELNKKHIPMLWREPCPCGCRIYRDEKGIIYYPEKYFRLMYKVEDPKYFPIDYFIGVSGYVSELKEKII
ncbi:hypothetical protein J7L81_02325, partial [Candidatus Aerophobetes bacterium]|nr:hypothetical protein [Candidatus Aerophobetes bacterium]